MKITTSFGKQGKIIMLFITKIPANIKSFDYLMAKSRVRIQYSIGKLETVDYI